jgi:SAM-dependent methyltransferase
LIGVDTAQGMIAAFTTKLASLNNPNLCAMNHLLTSADSPALQSACGTLRGTTSSPPHRFDLIVSHLTLHHIPSLPSIFSVMFECLKPGGVVALTDYEDFGAEAIRFHPVGKRPGVERHGINVDEAQKDMLGAGFEGVRVERAFVLGKEVDEEEGMESVEGEMEFPFLMVFGVRG